jgi:hypothetical protein
MARFRLNWKAHSRNDELEDVAIHSLLKLGMLAWIGVLAAGIGVIELFFPSFFNFPYWKWSLEWENVWKFYPLFLVGFGWNILFWTREYSSQHDGAILAAESSGYILTGLWEELLYRWAIIPYTMVALVFMNWFWGFGLPYILGIGGLLGGCYCIYAAVKDDGGLPGLLLGLVGLAIAGVLFWFGASISPIYWLFGNVLVPIADWTTFHMMGPAFTHPADALFLFGIFSANSAFRDGHKYQGPVGVVNSWYAGMVLIYATLTYGILTAIVVHALYDIIFAVMKYARRKLTRS